MLKQASYILLIVVCFASSFASSQTKKPTECESILQDLMSLQIDPGKVVHVQNATLRRDAARFEFIDGYWYFCKPVNGRVCSAFFSGDGVFSFSPPSDVEKKQLYRFFEQDSVNESFKFMFVLFADSSQNEISRLGKPVERLSTPDLNQKIKDCLRYNGDASDGWFDTEVMKFLLDGYANDLFYAQIGVKIGGPP
ncbi:MAG TPA: hypothetical protein VI704_06815, partial [Bacteroidota bacterium]|nr:hypothetical protein [Bacteroidota bacterium]